MTFLLAHIPLSLKRRSYRWMRLSVLTMIAMWFLPMLPALAQDTAGQASQGFFGQIQGFFGQIQTGLVATLAWINGLGPIAPIAFIILYVIITVSLLPASVITLGAGFVFGVVKGSLLVFLGAMLGATAAFLIGRYLARDWVSRKIATNDRFQAIDGAIAHEGRKIIFLIRLSPVFPFNLLNYALGLTNISLKDYILGTTGIIPGTIMYVYLGSLAGNLATLGAGETPSNPTITWIIRILAFLTTVAIVVYVTYVARKALKASAPSIAGDSNETVREG
ncbi:TVP38/TMEM64 family protein [Oscillatoria sp. CS-180]|uniref:TVP38/TMEM64 family protein n=1 Tax=Oscillatoria sp. CS-180 TaxID=3021720 RepID=UPI00232C2D3B|nr:TVP38/TMEM64 family protein [Oscillatoria sp. CS-180]MDB9527014.1 TVP38/TMEM64 family protein [Oscillatoria sp. CS-180]